MSDEPVVEPVTETPVPATEPVVETPVVEAVQAPVVEEPEPVVSIEPEPDISPAKRHAAAVKQKVRDALAAQAYRGAPLFEDLLVVADAIVDGLMEPGA